MLRKSFLLCFFFVWRVGLSATDTNCPGKCLPLEAPCEASSGTDVCGKDALCCLDESKETTTEAPEQYVEAVDAETEMRFQSIFEVEESTVSKLSTLLLGEPVEGREFRETETLKCPATCISGTAKRFCGYPFAYPLCGKSEICCFSEKESFKIKVLMHKSTTDPNSKAAEDLRRIFLIGDIGDVEYLNCQYRCVLRKHSSRCLSIYPDQYCPGTSVCCDESTTMPPEPIPENCNGLCVPPHLQDWCRPPRVLAPAQNCHLPTLCCEREQTIAQRSGLSVDTGEEKHTRVSPESNFAPPDEFSADDSHSGRTWMVADPASRLAQESTSESNLDSSQVSRIPVTYSSEEFLIPEEEASAQRYPSYLEVRPLCPGSCMSSFTRFLCFRNYTTYDGFYCPGKSVCCAKLDDIWKHEEALKATYPFLQGNFGKISSSCGKKGRKEQTTETVPGEWCWQVAIIDAQNQYVCGGALIDKSWVITTAQCVAGYVSQNIPLFIRAGVNDLSSPEENAAGQTRRVFNTYLHYSYDPVTMDNDIALLKLQNPVGLSENVCLACLPTRINLPGDGELCTLTGYGFVSEGAEMLFKMTEAQIPIVNELDCISNVTQALSTVYILPASSFCAGHEENHCQGGSGNPLVCKVDDHYELVGLVSWSVGCQIPDAPSVFVRTSALLAWINQVFATDHQLYSADA